MNVNVAVQAKATELRDAIAGAEIEVAADGETVAGGTFAQDSSIIDAVMLIAEVVQDDVDDVVLATISGHRTLEGDVEGDGFRPVHFSITVSKVDPAAL